MTLEHLFLKRQNVEPKSAHKSLRKSLRKDLSINQRTKISAKTVPNIGVEIPSLWKMKSGNAKRGGNGGAFPFLFSRKIYPIYTHLPLAFNGRFRHECLQVAASYKPPMLVTRFDSRRAHICRNGLAALALVQENNLNVSKTNGAETPVSIGYDVRLTR